MFAEVARKGGFEKIADIFLETAENEFEHAKRMLKFLEGGEAEVTALYPTSKVGTTKENLKEVAAGENFEHSKMYPEFSAIAEKEGFKFVANIFRMITKVEVEHEKRYLELLERVEKESYFKREKPIKWKCKKCGHIHEGPEPLGAYPLSLQLKSFFEPIV